MAVLIFQGYPIRYPISKDKIVRIVIDIRSQTHIRIDEYPFSLLTIE